MSDVEANSLRADSVSPTRMAECPESFCHFRLQHRSHR